MTRETKVGLVVSCSFLCLVGVVLFSKLKEKEETGTEAEAQSREEMVILPEPIQTESGAGALAQGPAPDLLPPPSGGIQQVSGAHPENAGGVPQGSGAPAPLVPPPSARDSAPLLSFPAVPPPPTEMQPAAVGTPAPAGSKEPPPLAPSEENSSTPRPKESRPAESAAAGSKPQPAEAKRDTKPGAGLASEGSTSSGNAPAPGPGSSLLTLVRPPLTLPAPPPLTDVEAKRPDGAPASTKPPEAPAPGAAPPSGPTPLPESERKPVPTPGSSAAVPAAPGDLLPVPSAEPARDAAQPGVTLRQPTAPPAPVASIPPSGDKPAGGATPPPPSPPPAAMDKAAENPIRLQTPTTPLPPANQVAQGPASAAAFPGGNSAPAPAARGTPARLDRPPVPGPKALESSPPVAAPVPQVESYDEETYRCKPSDTFLAISRTFYLTDKYERALQQYNRDHPLATDALRQDATALPTGQAIMIPPAYILEKKYGALIPQQPAPPPPAARPAPAPVGLEAPQPQGAGVRGQESGVRNQGPGVVPAATRPTPGNNLLYRVANNGERIREIAKRTLVGNPDDRWTEIYLLNRDQIADPNQPVPGGTLLRLPASATVPPENKP